VDTRVRVVGPLTVEHEGRELAGAALGGARERRLLAILACARGSTVTKEELAERLWDRPPRDPAAGIDTAVSLLRRALGPAGAVIETQRPGYRLACGSDLAEIDRLEASGRAEDALALLSGELLSGEPVTEWVHEQRRELSRRRVELLVVAAHAAATRGDDEVALARAGMAAEVDPLREDAHREVIAALARLGRDAEALRAYEHCRRVLREQLGVGPAPETSAVYEQVLAGGAPGRAPARAASSAGPPDALPFLGRQRELARLTAPSSGCAVRAVLGEPGIGKSRLIEEALTHLPSERTRVTKCFRLVSPVPYAVLSDLAPDLAAGVVGSAGPGTTTALSPEAVAGRLAGAWADDFHNTPTTLVIDDLQWADEPSLVALGLVLRRRPRGLLVLATARDGELPEHGAASQFLELADGMGALDSMVLGPLEPQDLAPAGFSFADWQRSGGHPLFLTQLVRGGEGDLARLVLDRAAAAGSGPLDVLRAAAVLDRAASIDELAAVAQLGAEATRQAVDRLRAAGLVLESGGTWRPRHDVIAELIRADLTEASRRAWHGRALKVVTASGASSAELAHQALAAGDAEATLRHSLDAGDRALAAFANREAADHYERAWRAAEEEHGIGDVTDRHRAVTGRMRALIVLGRTSEAEKMLEHLPPTEGRAEAERLLLQAECAWAAWKPSRAITPIRRALDIAERLADDELTGRVHAFAANPYGSLGELDQASRHIDAALSIAARNGRQPPAVVLYRLALIQHQKGREEDALRTLDRCRDAASDQHDERILVFERIVRSWALGALGRYGEALAALDDVASIGKGEEAVARARVPNTRASLLADLGLIDMALDADEESLEIARAHAGAAIAEPQIHTLLNLAADHLHLGDPDRAAACLEEVERLSGDAEYARFRYQNRLHWVRGRLALEGGDVDGALEQATLTSEMAVRYDAPKYAVRAELLRGWALARRSTERTNAVEALRAAARLAERHGFAALAEQAHSSVASLKGSDHHARRAQHWRAHIAGSVSGSLRDRLDRRS
jgi:DNA-binding SARP family transcriptional activator/tetratricopeptide (TPR) repeat protein